MAGALEMTLSDEEAALLDRASHMIRWLGRYPDALTRAELERAVESRATVLSSNDLLVASGIGTRVAKEIHARERHIAGEP
jgi:hypothetical protein